MNRSYKNTVIAILLACILTMAIGYAALQQRLNISGTSSITSVFKVKITNIVSTPSGKATNDVSPSFTDATANFSTNLVSPKDSMTYDITVENQGNLDAILKKITISDSGNPAIKFTSSGLKQGDILKYGESTVLTIKVEYDDSITSQPENISGNLTVKLDYEQLLPGINDIVETASSKLIATAVTSGDGLYASAAVPGKYVFRGAAPDNYVTFNGEEAGWRIVSVNEDGTIKLIRNSYVKKGAFDSDGLRDSGSNGIGGTYCAQTANGCNAWAATKNLVGSPEVYTNYEYSGTVLVDSEVNTYLNGTYYNSLTNEAKDQILSYNFSVGSPISIYVQTMISDEKSYLWNGKIGLINLSDFVNANSNGELCSDYSIHNSNWKTCKLTNWLASLVGSSMSDNAWTIAPHGMDTAYVHDIYGAGVASGSEAKLTSGQIIPVVYISGDGSLEGSGAPGDPYVISIK